jgi:hypothetical protein
MDAYINDCKSTEFSWFDFCKTYGRLATSIKNRDKNSIESNLIQVIIMLFKLSSIYNLNMQNAWSRWNTKAISKIYD